MAAIRKVINDVALQLETDVSGLTVGTNLFRGPVRPYTRTSAGTELIPRNAAFVSAPTEGPEPYPIAGSGWGKLRIASVQVIIRNTDTGSTMPQRIYDAFVSMVLPTGYLGIAMIGSGPAYLPGIDSNEDNMWSINTHVTYDQRETTSGDGELDFSDSEDSGWQSILFGFSP